MSVFECRVATTWRIITAQAVPPRYRSSENATTRHDLEYTFQQRKIWGDGSKQTHVKTEESDQHSIAKGRLRKNIDGLKRVEYRAKR